MTTAEVAIALGVHPVSVSRLQAEGLSGAVASWHQGRGSHTRYDRQRVEWFRYARACRRGTNSEPCEHCRGILAGLQVIGQHLRAAGHGAHEACAHKACSTFSPLVEGGVC